MASHRKRVLKMIAFFIIMLNYVMTFEGVLMVLYSTFMLNRWRNHIPFPPPSSAPTPADAMESNGLVGIITSEMLFELDNVWDSLKLPAPWFIYSFMGFGIVLCLVAFSGCLAANTRRRWGLCCYELLVATLVSTEAVIVTYIRVDEQWEQNLPYDPTGQIDSMRSFVQGHVAVCKRIGVMTILIQVFSLLLAFVLRLLVCLWAVTLDDEYDYEKLGGKAREPLLDPPSCQIYTVDPEIWSSLVREKNGSNNIEKYSIMTQNTAGVMKYEI